MPQLQFSRSAACMRFTSTCQSCALALVPCWQLSPTFFWPCCCQAAWDSTELLTRPATQVIAAFRGAEERVVAAASIFPALPDPTALPALLAALPREQRDAVHGRLGLLAFFDAANPTGRYHLDMGAPMHRVVLAQLVALSAQEGAWAADATLRNLRNVIVGSAEVDVPDPTVFVIPKSGHVQACAPMLCKSMPGPCCSKSTFTGVVVRRYGGPRGAHGACACAVMGDPPPAVCHALIASIALSV